MGSSSSRVPNSHDQKPLMSDHAPGGSSARQLLQASTGGRLRNARNLRYNFQLGQSFRRGRTEIAVLRLAAPSPIVCPPVSHTTKRLHHDIM